MEKNRYDIEVVEVARDNGSAYKAVLRWCDIESTFYKGGDSLASETRISLSGSRVVPWYPPNVYGHIASMAEGILGCKIRHGKSRCGKRRRKTG